MDAILVKIGILCYFAMSKRTRIMNGIIPSAVNLFSPADLQTIRFVRPTPGAGLEVLHEIDTPTSPRATILGIRRITLRDGDVIPMHRHTSLREKMYFHEGGVLRVFFGLTSSYKLMKHGTRLVIPPGIPHAAQAFAGSEVSFLVITSSQAQDVEWEPDVETLLQNKHLALPA